MYHRPVCVKCNIELMPERNGVTVVDWYRENQEIYQLWDADLWKCRKCDMEIVVGFGGDPYARHDSTNCQEMVDNMIAQGIHIINNYETVPVHHETIRGEVNLDGSKSKRA